MNAEIYRDVYSRLLADFDFKEKDEWLQQGRCPKCHKKELYTRAQSPWVLRCGRLNKCGEEIHIKELYPDLFESFSQRFQPTPTQPNASADAFMVNARGLNIDNLTGAYVQESYYDTKLSIGSATIRFKIAEGVFWERLIDKPSRFNRKANFIGPYQGMVWQHPNYDYKNAKQIWLTEGVFDAIALLENGIAAVSLMSCNNFPEQFLQSLLEANPDVLLVVALDSDKAGQKYTRKLVKRLKESRWNATAVQPPFKVGRHTKPDWNDLHQLGRLTEKDVDRYRYYGELLIAKTATAKAMVMHNQTQKQIFHFDFDSRLFQFKLDMDRYEKAMRNLEAAENNLPQDELIKRALTEANCITEIANCKPTALYYQQNVITDESWYYFKIEFPSGEVMKNTFTGGQLSSASEFKKRLLHVAKGAVYTGNSRQLDTLMLNQLQQIKTVDTIDFIGYSKEHKSYIFREVAISQGKLSHVNEEDFFELGKVSVKSLDQSVALSINPNLKEYNNQWQNLVWTAFGEKGLIALSYWFGSLFAEQIRQEDKSFPFLEIVGEPGSGKTTLIEFMWKLFGREGYEGFDPSKSTIAARSRNMSQVANMPVVFIEGDRLNDAKQKGFDWEETKPLYNGRSVRSRGMKTAGNQTYEPPFKGSLVIAQNASIDASPAVLERIIHLYTDKRTQSDLTKKAAEQLERLPMEALSGFLVKSVMAEEHVLSVYREQFQHYEKTLEAQEGLFHIRIIKNHAQLMALLEALSEIIPLEDAWMESTIDTILELAKARQKAVQADHPSVQEFWEVFDFLESNSCMVNHSSDEKVIAVNLNQFQQVAADWRQPIAPLAELKRLLKSGKCYAFLDIKTVKSAVNAEFNRVHTNASRPERMRCWVFKASR
ncbi:toprim domain-containing protein [Vibrio coralliilyticus]|uniref:toprim domain-containing protein n=1 Tax=Vibrio coralliilyticus TaxID=190893 RepID=UPI00148CE20F|nr:toprim domain-containing protein [Vibrio coralliilyticus]NOI31893.1 bifunctional DNA primase/helicase [Vibrio coralliilyticus]NOI51225.1 bifunctional DNA primase/helicase [Vibrio coralliilyticus]